MTIKNTVKRGDVHLDSASSSCEHLVFVGCGGEETQGKILENNNGDECEKAKG